ncbi:hypothetical protein HAX54_000760, partial [Datura stramonium]|nr:hypothetical protein [Datura stramonium]
MGATSTNIMKEWERKIEMRDRKITSIMELFEMITRKEMDTKIWSANAIRMVDRLEKFEDEKKLKALGDKDIGIK